jgi:hypothetical protein
MLMAALMMRFFLCEIEERNEMVRVEQRGKMRRSRKFS